MKYFISVLAMVLIIEGLPYFAFPEKVKETFSFILQLENRVLRIIGLFLITCGLILLYFFR